MKLEELKSAYEATYQKPTTDVFFSPGRVNLIGEHTDYNGGFVFPCALSFGTYLLIAPNNEQKTANDGKDQEVTDVDFEEVK